MGTRSPREQRDHCPTLVHQRIPPPPLVSLVPPPHPPPREVTPPPPPPPAWSTARATARLRDSRPPE